MAASRTSVAVLLALCANLSPVSAHQSVDDPPVNLDDEPPGPVIDQPTDGLPSLSCGIRLSPRGVAGSIGSTVTCQVKGAPTADTTFSVQVLKMASDGTAHPLRSASAEGTLSNDGTGACTILVNDPAAAPFIAGIVVAGTFHPSETAIGPMTLSPTIAGV